MERVGETVVLSADEYDELLYRLDFLEEIAGGLADAAAGRTRPHDEVFDRLTEKYAGGGAEGGHGLRSLIVSEPQVMMGKPVIAGTREFPAEG